jgi:hypothetical protein
LDDTRISRQPSGRRFQAEHINDCLYPDPAFEIFDKRFAKHSGGTVGLVRTRGVEL